MSQEYLRQARLIVADATGNGFDFGSFWVTFRKYSEDGVIQQIPRLSEVDAPLPPARLPPPKK
jgi:hypothetical protein